MKKLIFNSHKGQSIKILSKKSIAQTKWLSFRNVKFIDKKGNKQSWDYIARKGNRKVVTLICQSERTNKFLLICQPRIPIGKYVIEFPAGLVDKGESIQRASRRELKEETGYNCKILQIIRDLPKSAGITSEENTLVRAKVNEKAIGKTEMEDTEDIKHIWVSAYQFRSLLRNLNTKKYCISNEVVTFFMGLNMKIK